ncbi:SDR family NAD(P)-dependent oxidoreductase [Sphingomonas fennica]|uniref:Oxidoreductase n=1 Tax=Edaphosphingomonas fennica TaxID=114404 RepID=A0A2T4I560_9SPHN|nr:SDR family oxidoreductase [Sphingomonas fennica]PTD24960.1 oxidoreductase [Sphingomonas fennica]
MRGLDGKAILIAGGGGGIGAASAERLAAEGARVVVGDLFLEGAEACAARIRAAGGDAVAIGYDQAEEASIAGLVAATVDRLGKLDCVLANAADMQSIMLDGDVLSCALDVFDRSIQVDMRGYFLIARHALPHLIQSRGAIAFTSSAASIVGEPERVAYGMAKAAVNALTRHIASRWGKEGVRSNAILPGFVYTEKTRDHLPEEFRRHAVAATRSTRLGEPADIAAMVAHLFSDDGAWINGQTLSVDGGATMR